MSIFVDLPFRFASLKVFDFDVDLGCTVETVALSASLTVAESTEAKLAQFHSSHSTASCATERATASEIALVRLNGSSCLGGTERFCDIAVDVDIDIDNPWLLNSGLACERTVEEPLEVLEVLEVLKRLELSLPMSPSAFTLFTLSPMAERLTSILTSVWYALERPIAALENPRSVPLGVKIGHELRSCG